AAVIAHEMVREGQIEPIDRPTAEQAAIGPERGEGRDRFAGAIERQRALGHQPQRLRIRRDDGHLARGLEGSLPVAPALDEHPCEVVLVERRKAPGERSTACAIESAVANSPRSICSCAAKISGSRNVVSSRAARLKWPIAPRESNCTMRSSPWMNSWYAGNVGG